MKYKHLRILVLSVLCACILISCGKPVKTTDTGVKRERSAITVTPTATPTPEPTPTIEPTPTSEPTPTGSVTPAVYVDPEACVDAARFGITSQDVIDYYCEVGMTSEYNGPRRALVRKWTEPIMVTLEGDIESADMDLMERLFDYLNSINGFPGISFTSDDFESNFIIRILPEEQYQEYARPRVNGDATDGYSTIWYNEGIINKAEIGISADLERMNKNHVILEEIVQSLGLQNDSYSYPDSLFYQDYNTPQWPSDLDCLLVEFLYHPLVTPGIGKDEVISLSQSLINGVE